MRDYGHDAHQEQDHRNDGRQTDQVVVCPADQAKDQPPPDGEADSKEREGAEQRLADGVYLYGAVDGEAEDHGDDDPADGVVDDGAGDNDLADIAPHEVHLAHDDGHDLH